MSAVAFHYNTDALSFLSILGIWCYWSVDNNAFKQPKTKLISSEEPFLNFFKTKDVNTIVRNIKQTLKGNFLDHSFIYRLSLSQTSCVWKCLYLGVLLIMYSALFLRQHQTVKTVFPTFRTRSFEVSLSEQDVNPFKQFLKR